MVNLAPHLVHPLPLLVPGFDGKRPDRARGRGAEHVRRDGARAPAPPPGRRGVEPGPPPDDQRRGDARADPGARGAQPHLRLSLLRLPDRRRAPRAHRAGRGGALRRRDRQPREVTGLVDRNGRAAGVLCIDARDAAASSSCARTTSSTPPACGPTSCGPTRSTARRRCRASARAAARTSRSPQRTCRCRAGAIVPAGGGRTIFALPWLGRTLIGTTDNDYEGPLDHIPPDAGRHRVPARRVQRVLRHRARCAPTSPAPTPACAR